MMVNPSNRVKELLEIIIGWRVFDPDTETFSIRDDAPDEVKKALEELQKII